MALDFPASPTVGQTFSGYVWNGYAWAFQGATGYVKADGTVPFTASQTGITEATADNSTKLATTGFVKAQNYATAAQLAAYLPLTGGTLTGALLVKPSAGVSGVQLRGSGASDTGIIEFMLASGTRRGYIYDDNSQLLMSSEGGKPITLNSSSGVIFANTQIQASSSSGAFYVGGSGNNLGSYWRHRGVYFGSGAGAWGFMDLQSILVPGTWAALRLGLADTVSFDFRNDGQAYKSGGGSWGDISDERIKTAIKPYQRGLAEILQLNPVSYRFKGNDTLAAPSNVVDGEETKSKAAPKLPYRNSWHYQQAKDKREYIGLIAQAVENPFPECVRISKGFIDGVAVEDMRELDPSPLVFALINAVKTLAARVEELEAKLK